MLPNWSFRKSFDFIKIAQVLPLPFFNRFELVFRPLFVGIWIDGRPGSVPFPPHDCFLFKWSVQSVSLQLHVIIIISG